MILVTTAGKVGSAAVGALLEQGTDVRVLARVPDKAGALAEAGADVVQGDLGRPATIDAAMQGVTSVVLVSPAVPAQELNVVASAARAGVEHVVKITSDASADSPIRRRRDQASIEQGLASSGIQHTLLRNNAYMQNLLMLAPVIAKTGGFRSSAGNGRIGMVDARDVGAVAAVIAAAPAEHAGKTYWPTGPEALSYADAAAVLTAVLGRPIAFAASTAEEDREAMVSAGLPPQVAEDNARALGLFAAGEADYVTEDVPKLLGRPARTFEQFATDYAAAFS